ncbi:hypothetical protein CPB84DRAFT_1777663 [Gymnopilus junonius]|uniref:Cytochrome c oxidase subunit 8, mitochondrial n=1 Tax=Gymnopilus junonius TaxID=109634 RepID=A0A9P5NNM5_GYMJU|nr:hypothetical protein CPB84DRAFT_1777663 [Gymnopilus junonius]
MSLQSGRYLAASLSRSPALLLSRQRITQQAISRRMAHDVAHEPFPFSTKNKKTLAVKFVAFYCTGLAIPVFAVWRSLKRFNGEQ